MPQKKPEPSPPQRRPAPNRVPIQVGILKFPASSDPGIPGTMSSAVSDRRWKDGRSSRHEIQYEPWLRAFRVTYHAPEAKAPQVVYVPEGRVVVWYPLEQPEAAPASK